MKNKAYLSLLNNRGMDRINYTKNLLILNNNQEERKYLYNLFSKVGHAYSASTLEKTISFLESNNINVIIVKDSMAHYSSLKGLLKKTTSILIIGKEEKNLNEISSEWPQAYHLDTHVFPSEEKDNNGLLRTLESAVEHSKLKMQVENLRNCVMQNDIDMKEAFLEIKEIKNVIQDSIVKELEKRIEVEAKYFSFKKEKLKIEHILKKLYRANDVTSLLDIVDDIKEIVQAQGISIYIIDENETLGKYIKPLVWDDSILSHPDFSKHIVLIDSQDFAASVANDGLEINSSNPVFDNRLSRRYIEQLKFPLENILSVPIMHDRKIIGVLEVYNKSKNKNSKKRGFSKEEQQVMRRLSEHISIAITKLNLIQYDALTGLLRPDPFFNKIIHKLKLEKKRYQEQSFYSLVMGDVDWFKNYNDRNGHEAGNKLLRELASILKSSIREEDFLCRYGGEEFVFFLSSIKSKEEAFIFTERIRKNVEEHYFEHQEFQPRNNMTMSFGITNFSKDKFTSLDSITKNSLKKIVNEADMALAEAKGKRALQLGIKDKKKIPNDKNRISVYCKEKIDELGRQDIVMPYKEIYAQERRTFKRYYTSTVLIYKNDRSQSVTKTINLSLNGAKISSELKLPKDKTYEIIIILGNKACQCKGNVVYSEKLNTSLPYYHSGLKFRELPLKDRIIFEDYFNSINTKGSSLSQ